MKIIDNNKKAYFDYYVEETIEVGVALLGSEVKSIWAGHVSLRDSFCHIDGGELWLKNCNITPYEKGSVYNAEAKRDRKLLAHRSEINRISAKQQAKGYTLVPTKIYFLGNKVKLEIGLCKGKQLHDKRDVLKAKETKRMIDREISKY